MALEDFKQKFGGKWKQEKTENLEEFFKLMDLNIVDIKLLMEVIPMEGYKIDGDHVILINNVGPMSSQSKFKLNEEFEEERMGIKMKSVGRYENGKMKIESSPVNNPEVKPQFVTIEKLSDDQSLSTIVVGENDLVCKRYFKKVSE